MCTGLNTTPENNIVYNSLRSSRKADWLLGMLVEGLATPARTTVAGDLGILDGELVVIG